MIEQHKQIIYLLNNQISIINELSKEENTSEDITNLWLKYYDRKQIIDIETRKLSKGYITRKIEFNDFRDELEKHLCKLKGISHKSLLEQTKTRKREFVETRMICMTIAKRYCQMSLSSIGEIYDKDHATVLHAIKTVNNLCDTDKRFKEFYTGLVRDFIPNDLIKSQENTILQENE